MTTRGFTQGRAVSQDLDNGLCTCLSVADKHLPYLQAEAASPGQAAGGRRHTSCLAEQCTPVIDRPAPLRCGSKVRLRGQWKIGHRKLLLRQAAASRQHGGVALEGICGAPAATSLFFETNRQNRIKGPGA